MSVENNVDFTLTGDDDLPGMLALAEGIAEQKWPHSMDAKVWAEEFCKRFHPIDRDISKTPMNTAEAEGLMLAWFASAIMAGYDTACFRSAEGRAHSHVEGDA